MNRRRFFIALAVITPLSIFGAAKWAAQSRPVALGQIFPGAKASPYAYDMEVSPRYVFVDGNNRFDLATRETRFVKNQGLAELGVAQWELNANQNYVQLVVRDGKQKRIYVTPIISTYFNELNVQSVRVERQHVELLLQNRYYRWDNSGQLVRRIIFPLGDINPKISRDGETIIVDEKGYLCFFSTRTGKAIRRTQSMQSSGNGWNSMSRLSPFGNYMLVRHHVVNANFTRWAVEDTRNGQALWTFDLDSDFNAASFSPDETQIALPLIGRHVWQIRDLKTGNIIRTLPLVPGSTTGALSPDNSTLYSVADGVLYRQRAR